MPCNAKWSLAYCYAASLITLLRCCKTFPPDPSSDGTTCTSVEPSQRFCPFKDGVWNTSYPNVFNHTSYSQADQFLSNYADLFESQCSEHLSYFLCYALIARRQNLQLQRHYSARCYSRGRPVRPPDALRRPEGGGRTPDHGEPSWRSLE